MRELVGAAWFTTSTTCLRCILFFHGRCPRSRPRKTQRVATSTDVVVANSRKNHDETTNLKGTAVCFGHLSVFYLASTDWKGRSSTHRNFLNHALRNRQGLWARVSICRCTVGHGNVPVGLSFEMVKRPVLLTRNNSRKFPCLPRGCRWWPR